MNLMRKASMAASSAVLLTAVGAVSGVCSSAAQAYEVSPSNEVVTVALDSTETAAIAASDRLNPKPANVICWSAVQEAFAAAPFAPMNDINCAPSLHDCAVLAVAAGRQLATVVFRWDRITCQY